MTTKQIIAKHYGKPESQISDEAVIHELVSLRRKKKKGNLDDVQERLVAELQINKLFSCKD